MTGRGVVGLMCALIVGATLGVALDRAVLLHHGDGDDHSNMALHRAMMVEMEESVGLSPSQVNEVQERILHRQALVDETWREVRPELDRAIDSLRHEIEMILEPDQHARFEDFWVRAHAQVRARSR